jgi:hypothetical protein
METKNELALRKNLGYAHVRHACAQLLNSYHKGYLNPHINSHRPCFFPLTTPHEGLKSLARTESCLRPSVTLEKLSAIANPMATINLHKECSEFAPVCFNKSQDLPSRLPEGHPFRGTLQLESTAQLVTVTQTKNQ